MERVDDVLEYPLDENVTRAAKMEKIAKIKDDIVSFVKDAPQNDDIALVTLKYLGNDIVKDEKSVIAKKGDFEELLTFLSDFARNNHIDEEFRNKLVVVGDELFSNIVQYGYSEQSGEIKVTLSFDKALNEFSLTLIDMAKAFNPPFGQ